MSVAGPMPKVSVAIESSCSVKGTCLLAFVPCSERFRLRLASLLLFGRFRL